MIDPDYLTFAGWHVASGDVDPVYPVLQHLHPTLCADPSEQVAFTMLYVAYYSLPSAVAAWLDGWREGDLLTDTQMRYGTGVERRAHRDVRQFSKHMEALQEITRRYGALHAYLAPEVTNPLARWSTIQHRLEDIYGNGRWAGYKTGEILDTVHGWDCPPPDAGHANSSGPRHGLADLFPDTAALTGNHESTIRQLDGYTNRLVDATGLPVAQVETTLCDWHNVLRGAYYIGHDIDQMLEQTLRAGRSDVIAAIIGARESAFDRRWLGELQGWPAVRKPLKRLYVDEKRLEWWS